MSVVISNQTAAKGGAGCTSVLSTPIHEEDVDDALNIANHLKQSPIIPIGSNTKQPIQVGPNGERNIRYVLREKSSTSPM